MNQPGHKSGREELEEGRTAVLEILNRWDTILGSPADKYQSLAYDILRALGQDVSGADLESLIINAMQFHLGIDVPELEVRKVRQEIMAWWRQSIPSTGRS